MPLNLLNLRGWKSTIENDVVLILKIHKALPLSNGVLLVQYYNCQLEGSDMQHWRKRPLNVQ